MSDLSQKENESPNENKNNLKSSFNGKLHSHSMLIKKQIRKDKFGNVISKKIKNHKISFSDQIGNNQEIAEVKKVESYKEIYKPEWSNSKII